MATAILSAPRITPEQFWELPESERYELVEGRLSPFSVNEATERIVNRISDFLCQRLETIPVKGLINHHGATFQCFNQHPETVRRLHFSYLSDDRIVKSGHRQHPFHFFTGPNLAVRICSQEDLAETILGSVSDFLSAQADCYWMIMPGIKRASWFDRDRKGQRIGITECLRADYVFPGLKLPLEYLLSTAE